MMKKISEKIKDVIRFFVPAIIIFLILMIIYAIKGIYPFGKMTIVHADLAQIFVNNYIYYINSIYSGDVFNFIYSNELNYGTNILGTALPSGFFSPFSLMYLLCKDVTKLTYFMSFFLIIKACLASMTANICFNKIFGKENYKFNIIFSIQYALSSFVLINYTTIIWLDVIIIFPLLIMSLKNIIERKTFVPYSLLLTLSILIHYQMSYVILFMILATIPFAIREYSKDIKKEIIFRLGVGTVWGLLIPSVVFFPCIEIFLTSYRTTLQSELINSPPFFTKLANILFSGVSLYGLIKLQKNIEKDKNIQLLDIFILLTGVIPIIFEGVNKIWHGGEYDSFPFRFGFIPTFFISLAGNYYYSKYMNQEKNKLNTDVNILFNLCYKFIFIITIGTLCCVSYSLGLSSSAFEISYLTVYIFIIYIVLVCWILEFYILNKKTKNIYLVALIEVLILGFGCIGLDEEYRSFHHSDWQIFNSFNILEKFDDKLDYTGYRYRDNDYIMLENSPLVTNLPSNSSWILNKKEHVDLHSKLGYSRLHLKLSSLGGTVFSDALLNIKYIFSRDELSDLLYNKIAQDSDVRIYEYKNALPIGIVYDGKNDIINIPKNLNNIDFSNWIYKNIFSKEDDILEIEEKKVCLSDATNIDKTIYKNGIDDNIFVEFNFEIKGQKKLYFINKNLSEYVRIERYGEVDCYYPTISNNGFVDLGVCDNENIKIKISTINSKQIDINSFEFATIDLDKFTGIFENNVKTTYKTEKNEIYLETTVNEENKKIFLPIAYDKNWIAEVNGKEVKVQNAIGAMISLDLEKGFNTIKLTLKNKTIKIGFILTIFAIIGLIITELGIKKIIKFEKILEIVYIIFNIVVLLFLLIVYVGGIIITFIG